MAARFQFVAYDARGNGLSQRDVALTPEAMALDLQAVVDQLALENFFVFAPFGQAVSCDVLESLGRSSVTGPLSGTVVLV